MNISFSVSNFLNCFAYKKKKKKELSHNLLGSGLNNQALQLLRLYVITRNGHSYWMYGDLKHLKNLNLTTIKLQQLRCNSKFI